MLLIILECMHNPYTKLHYPQTHKAKFGCKVENQIYYLTAVRILGRSFGLHFHARKWFYVFAQKASIKKDLTLRNGLTSLPTA